jgi:hypothetical protein
MMVVRVLAPNGVEVRQKLLTIDALDAEHRGR